MILLAADENLNNAILRGALRRKPDLDIIRIQGVGLSGAGDSTVLEWAAQENRVLLTHDVATITHYAYERVKAELPMPGVFEISYGFSVGEIIDDILLIAEYSIEGEWADQVRYLPLR